MDAAIEKILSENIEFDADGKLQNLIGVCGVLSTAIVLNSHAC